MNTQKTTKLLKQISIILLILVSLTQLTTIFLLESDCEGFDIEELHEICGFLFFPLILFHVVLHWKSLKYILSSKSK